MNNDQLKVAAIEALETCAIGSGGANGFTKTYWFDEQKVKAAIAALTAAQSAQSTSKIYTYASTQATTCAGCGKHKHTPLRIDAMGGYVCLTCIDQKLGSLLDEFGYPESAGKDEREVFEKWYGSTGGRRSPEEMMVEVFCWDAWQAGRASLAKVEREPVQCDLRMDAYYYGFDQTGVPAIDRILSAVACAGKAHHHTEDWGYTTTPYTGHVGNCAQEWIQNAANDAAKLYAAAPQIHQESKTYTRAEVQQWRDDVAHAAADMAKRADTNGEWTWLVDSIRALAANPQAQQEARCTSCDGMGDIIDLTGEWRGHCHCGAQQEAGKDAQDAARYRWLRQQHWSDTTLGVVVRPKTAVRLGHDCPSLERLDDAIDAAMQASPAQADETQSKSQIKGCGTCRHRDDAPGGACETCFSNTDSITQNRLQNWEPKADTQQRKGSEE